MCKQELYHLNREIYQVTLYSEDDGTEDTLYVGTNSRDAFNSMDGKVSYTHFCTVSLIIWVEGEIIRIEEYYRGDDGEEESDITYSKIAEASERFIDAQAELEAAEREYYRVRGYENQGGML